MKSSNHLPKTHGLNIEEYEELVKSQTKLQQVKMATGFTDKLGQCGFCMKQFNSFANLRYHRKNTHYKRGVGKGTEANKKQLPKPGNKSSERKGVSLKSHFTLYHMFSLTWS